MTNDSACSTSLSPTPLKWADGVDFILPLGNACRPARQLKSAGLRTFSTPLDWMMRYPLDLAADLIINGFEGFFSCPEEDPVRGKGKNNRYVIDKATGMISMHGFSWAKSLEEELPAFYEKMLRRGRRLKEKILEADRIGILMNRNEKEETILAFIRKLSAAFPQQQFYILNLFDDKSLSANQRSRRIIDETESYSVCEIRLNDTHKDGDDPKKNPNFWLGNVPAWQEIIPQEFSMKKAKIKVSVIIPCYNVEKYLRECLDSVVNQTLKEIEIICINDGSKDGTLDILREYGKLDSRVLVIDQENQGVGRSRNNGIKAAQGEFVCFMDPDDWYPANDVLKELHETAKRENVEICGGSMEEHHPDGTVVRDFSPTDSNWGGKFSSNGIVPFKDYQYDWGYQRFIFSRSFLFENDIFFPPYIRFQDPPFFVKAMVLSGRFYALKKITYAYRVAYKPPAHYRDARKCEDIFRGVFDCIVFAQKYGYPKLLERYHRFWGNEWVVSQWLPTFEAYPQIRPTVLKAWNEVSQSPILKASKNWLNVLNGKNFGTHFSIVIPVYNTEKYLRECLDSVCKQDLRDIEIICVNDGSTDGSLAILEEYAQKDPRVRVISQENSGLGAARNVGLAHSNGEFIYFMDSDDVSPSGALSKMYTALKGSGLDALFFSASSFYETPELEQSHAHYKTYYTRKEFDICNGQTLGVKLQNVKSNFASACCYCCRRQFLVENEISFPERCLYEDNAVFWTILKNAQRAKSISTPLFLRRVRQNSIMTNRKLDFRNFEGYAKTISIFEKLSNSGNPVSSEFDSILKTNANAFSGTLVRFYLQIPPADRIRSRELLSNELRNSKWLDSVRVNIAKIEGVTLPLSKDFPAKQAAQPACKNPHPAAVSSAAKPSNTLPRFLVRLGAMFIWNKAARKRWREAHMDLTPRNGIDINANPELRRDSALKRFAVRTAALFIFSKSKRRAFRARHLNLEPKDGVDVRTLSPEARRLRKQKKRERNPLRRLFNALVPATRSKLSHAEKRLTRHMEWQTQQILAAVKSAQAQTDRKLTAMQSVQAQLKNQHEALERGLIRERELAQKALTDSLKHSENTLGDEIAVVLKRQKALESAAIENYSRDGKAHPHSLEFRTFGDLAHCIRTQLHKIPADADLVVGLPRSGMIPAYMIALFMNKKCCSLDEFLNGTSVSHGYRPITDTEPRKILVVDDSCYSGRAMDLARERLKPLAGKYEFVYTAVYGRTESLSKLDCCLESVDGKRVWQWNYLNHSLAQAACFDMDGVLCVDPTAEENDDGPKYLNFIKTAAPLYIPTYRIRAIVTSRLEKYREPTEAWLREHGVQYDELVMLDLPTAEERRRQNCHASFKAEVYKARRETTLFVESEDRQAKEIAFLTGKEVLCVSTDRLY